MRGHYLDNAVPGPASLLRALVFQESIAIDANVLKHIRQSRFTNVLNMDELKEGGQLVPDASPFMLVAAATTACAKVLVDGKAVGGTAVERLLAPMLDQAFLFRAEADKATGERRDGKGTPLERIFGRWWEVRLAAAIDAAPGGVMPLGCLMGIDSVAPGGSSRLVAAKHASILLPKSFGDINVPSESLPNSTDAGKEMAFLAALSKVVVSPEQPVAILKLHALESFDHAVLCLTADGLPFLTIYDNKAPIVDSAENGLSLRLPGGGKQAWRVKELSRAFRDVPSGGMSAADALRDGRFLFVYASTGAGPSFADERAVVLKGSCMRRFLGPFYGVHDAVRKAW